MVPMAFQAAWKLSSHGVNNLRIKESKSSSIYYCEVMDSVRLGSRGYKFPLCYRDLLGDSGPITHHQPNLSHRSVVKIKWKRRREEKDANYIWSILCRQAGYE